MPTTHVVPLRQHYNICVFERKIQPELTPRLNLPSNFFTFMAAKDDSNVDKGDNCIDRYQMCMLLKLQCILSTAKPFIFLFLASRNYSPSLVSGTLNLFFFNMPLVLMIF